MSSGHHFEVKKTFFTFIFLENYWASEWVVIDILENLSGDWIRRVGMVLKN